MPKLMKKLWQKDEYELDSIVETFETKGDLLLDQKLLPYDIKGSIAHAKMLHKISIITSEELKKLEKGLNGILVLNQKGEFQLELGDEDIHTKIENYLIDQFGNVGKKIHTLRSRNDQVLTAIRLFSKAELEKLQEALKNLINNFKIFKTKYGKTSMPGYTHMQKAMPSSIGLWIGSFISSLEDDLEMLKNLYNLIDQSPLGSAAGYGIPLKIDKEYTANLLHFKKVQPNPLYCQNSKGKFEAAVVSTLIQILLTINKFSSDLMLFTTQEFGFFEASPKITTGSSMMPQKKNLDLAELLRGKVHLLLGNYTQLVSLSSNLISGYNRDLQDIKKPLMESLEIALDSLIVTNILLKNISPKKEALKKAMTQELYTTEKAYKLVEKGIPFRDAYLKVKELKGAAIYEK